ncbi:MAG: hypothetical protein MUE31_14485 [Candidatus Nanopelagicales bacterium]|jgi:hypothetical protein|nr:hypothetical protein [Candidatus Nanopelagicales bacterium]
MAQVALHLTLSILSVTAPAMSNETDGSPPEGWFVYRRGSSLSVEDRRCSNDAKTAWRVGLTGARVVIALAVSGGTTEPPPAHPEWVERLNARRALKLAGGWLLAIDRGEFGGGGLWWASAEDDQKRRVLPFNISELRLSTGGDALAFAGTAHFDVDAGWVYQLNVNGRQVDVRLLGSLDGRACVADRDDTGFLAVTNHGVWSVRADAEPRRLAAVDLMWLLPNSIARAPDGAIYVGMNAFVLRLRASGDLYEPEWLLPVACRDGAVGGDPCRCSTSAP